MYFHTRDGKQRLDLRGNLILSHNTDLVKMRNKSAGPRSVHNGKYVVNITRLAFVRKVRATWAAIKFIWGPSQELTSRKAEQL